MGGEPGEVARNAVYLHDGEVQDLAGGKGFDVGSTHSNHVYIYGGKVTGNILAGWGNYGTLGVALNNSVSIFGSPDLTSARLMGREDDATSWEAEGNTLNLHTQATVRGVSGFQNYNFYLPSTFAAGATMLTVTEGDGTLAGGPIDIGGTTVHVGVKGGGSPLQKGDIVTLIKETGGYGVDGAPQNTSTSGEGMQGITQGFAFDLTTTLNSLLATVTAVAAVGADSHIDNQLKSLVESRIAGIGILAQGADMLHTQGITQLRAGVANMPGSMRPALASFGVMGGSSMRFNSGSHVDMDSFNMATGLGWNMPFDEGRNGNLLLGAFFEAGWGDYDSHNSFSSGSVKGEGDASYRGGGVLARYDSALVGPGTAYTEVSFRAGRVKTDYESSDFKSAEGGKVDFDSSAAYYGMHAGVGYIWNIAADTSLDINTKYLWTRQDSDCVSIQGDRIRFKATDSHRWRSGAKFAHSLKTESGLFFTPYGGAAYEHEFDSKAEATANGKGVDSPDVKGGTGIGELGLAFKPSEYSGFSVDLGMQGYVGKREGVGGNLQVKFEF